MFQEKKESDVKINNYEFILPGFRDIGKGKIAMVVGEESTIKLMFVPSNNGKLSSKIILPEGLGFVTGGPEFEGRVASNETYTLNASVMAERVGIWTVKGVIESGDNIYSTGAEICIDVTEDKAIDKCT